MISGWRLCLNSLWDRIWSWTLINSWKWEALFLLPTFDNEITFWSCYPSSIHFHFVTLVILIMSLAAWTFHPSHFSPIFRISGVKRLKMWEDATCLQHMLTCLQHKGTSEAFNDTKVCLHWFGVANQNHGRWTKACPKPTASRTLSLTTITLTRWQKSNLNPSRCY